MTPQEMVERFHTVFGLEVREKATFGLFQRRRTLITEEYMELLEELQDPFRADLAQVAKELADLVYVLYGTAVALGINLDEALWRVHLSNMSKRAPDGTITRRSDGKVLKPDTYQTPDMSGVLYTGADSEGRKV